MSRALQPSADRATHEPSQQAVSAVPVGIPSAWQPIKTAPYNKTHVALLRRNEDGSVTYGHGYYMPLGGWRCWKHHANKPPTHWYPLPDPFAQGIEAPSGDETQSGSTVGKSPVAESHAPKPGSNKGTST